MRERKKKFVQVQTQRKDTPVKRESTERCPSRNGAVVFLLAHSMVVMATYIYTMYPDIPGGDSGELIVAAHELGVAHPPGYPVFTLLLWATIKIIPFGSVAWRASLLNAILSAGATLIFSLTIYRYTRSVGVSVIGASVWSFNKLTWTWSTTVEVFSLNNLCVAVLLYLMAQFEGAESDKKLRVACLGSFMCGICLCNQHTSVVYVAVIAAWVLYELARVKSLSARTLMMISVFFLIGLVPYIYLPLSSVFSSGRWTWGNQSSVEGFLKHLLRKEYGTFQLAKKEGDSYIGYGMISGLRVYFGHLLSEFTFAGCALVTVGAVSIIKKHCTSLIVAMVMCLTYLLLFCWRANLDLDNQLYLGVVERFWMQSDMVVVLLAAVGLSALYRMMEPMLSSKNMIATELALASAVFSIYVGKNFSECNQRNNTVIAEFGSRLISNMPQNALVLTVGDLPSNVLRYLYLCGNDRPDVTVLDQEMMTYGWFVPQLKHAYPSVSFPGHHMEVQTGHLDNGQPVFNFKTFLDSNINRRPIIGCIGVQMHERSWQSSYIQFPYGPCSLILKSEEQIHIESVYKDANIISADWNYPAGGFDAKSWERVATDEMWNAKVNMALRLYEMAVEQQDTDDLYSGLMIESYELYKKAVDRESVDAIPAYWHRNYALAGEHMLRLKHNYTYNAVLKDVIYHYEVYIQKDPTDQSVPIIKKTIERLKSFIGKL